MAATLDDLKRQIHDLPLSEIMGKYVHIQRVGSQTKAVCPFHDDHDPSLQINDDKGLWYCFVDQIGGDAIKFVQLLKSLDFKAALEDICDAMGWNYQDYAAVRKANPKYEMGKKILTKAGQLYQKLAASGKYPAFQDFLARRGLDGATADTYELGFASRQNPLSHYLQSIPEEEKRQFALKVALELGIIKAGRRDGTYYDQFRERIIFPIWDSSGQIIGLTGRASRPEQKPKYFNSVDSFLFRKHDLLYGLHLAKRAIRDQGCLILVEGNMDQMALHQAGFKHCVAIMGTGFRDSTAARILSLSRKIYLCLDNDQGGQKAAARVNKFLMEQEILALTIELRPHKDPDELIQNEGRLEFQKRIDQAKTFVDVQIENAFPRPVPELPERKLEALTECFDILAPLGKAISATERIIALAKRLGLQSDSASIVQRYEHFLDRQYKPAKAPEATSAEIGEAMPQEEERPNEDSTLQERPPGRPEEMALAPAEKILLQNLIQYPQLLICREFEHFLDFVQSGPLKAYLLRLGELIYEIDQAEYIGIIKGLIGSGECSGELAGVTVLALDKYSPVELESKIVARIARDLRCRLKKEQLKSKKREIKERQSRAQTEEESKALLAELSVLDRQMAEPEKQIRPLN